MRPTFLIRSLKPISREGCGKGAKAEVTARVQRAKARRLKPIKEFGQFIAAHVVRR